MVSSRPIIQKLKNHVKGKMHTMKKKTVNYVDNEKFYSAIVEYRKHCDLAEQKGLDRPQIPDYIGECILKISKNLALLPKFSSYSYKDEMISDAIENSVLYFHSFDPEKSNNPFAYFTQVTYYAYLRRLNFEEKTRYMTYKSFIETIGINDMSLLSDSEGNAVASPDLYDNIYEFMRKFEKKEEENA